MAGIRGLMAAVVMTSSAVISLPAGGQAGSSVSLTHTVSVSVPPRLKVQVANLAFSSQASAGVSSVRPKAAGLSITVNATQAWVLSIGSGSGSAAPKSRVQWSTEGSSGFTSVSAQDVAVASGVSYDAKESNVFFRSAPDAKLGGREAEVVVLTVSAP
jgi:hypothetical protein